MKLLVTEIFHSLQGESTLAGLPFAFIRLTGCNLRCTYCDSAYAFHGGTQMSIDEILATIKPYQTPYVLLTGGEPLIQKHAIELLKALKAKHYEVSVETSGETSIEHASPLAKIIMDIKTPASGMSRGGYVENLRFLKSNDEIKFVIASPDDYGWAKQIVQSKQLPVREILFSPVMATQGAPGAYPGVEPKWLAEQILKDKLPVRFQLQIHKLIWGPDQKGV